MAEALAIVGLVSSIVQFVDFSSKIADRLNEFHSSLDEVPKCFRDLKTELPLLSETLRRTKIQAEDNCLNKFTQEAILGVVKGCQSQVELLDDLLEKTLPKTGDSSWRRGKKALLSVTQEKKVQQITTTLGNYIRTLTYHQATSSSTDANRGKIHRWLSAPDPWLNYNKARGERQAGTGTWLMKSDFYADWKTNPNSFLWLHGIPGCGKTILSSTVIEDVLCHCSHDHSLAVLYFYFDFNDVEKQQHEKMIRSLILQLSFQCKDAPRDLQSLFSFCRDGDRPPPFDELLAALQKMIREFKGVYIILDALDECEDRGKLLEEIETITSWKLEHLHTPVTSRREKDIEESLDCLVDGTGKIGIQSALVNDDIHTYVHQRLQTDQKLKRWQNRPQVQQEIETILVSKADGMFRWAVCQLDALTKCLNLRKLREAMADLPNTLDGTYDRILCAIDKEYSQDAFRILQWLVYSVRPLRIEEVVDVIAVGINDDPRFDLDRRLPDPRDILTICSSLVTMTVEAIEKPFGARAGEYVRLAHFSVKEYLVSKRIQDGPAAQFSIQEIPANAYIAEICLAYLLQFDQPDSLTSQTVKEFPLARYAAEFWTQHAQIAGENQDAMHSLIMELLLSNTHGYINCIRLFNPEYPWNGELDTTSNLTETFSPLHYVSLNGLTASVRLLLEAGADANARGGEYGNALQAASHRGHDQVVQRLLEKGADVNAQGGHFGNALQAALLQGHDQVVQRLLEKRVDVNAQGGRYGNALQAASLRGHDQIVQRLLEKGADVNAQGGEFGNALQAASYRGHDQVVQRLLEKEVDVNAQGGWYDNALQAASYGGHDQVVQQLLEKGANVNAQGGYCGNALQAASYGDHDQVVQRLLEKGADVNTQGGHFGNALRAASLLGHDQVVQRLKPALQSQQDSQPLEAPP